MKIESQKDKKNKKRKYIRRIEEMSDQFSTSLSDWGQPFQCIICYGQYRLGIDQKLINAKDTNDRCQHLELLCDKCLLTMWDSKIYFSAKDWDQEIEEINIEFNCPVCRQQYEISISELFGEIKSIIKFCQYLRSLCNELSVFKSSFKICREFSSDWVTIEVESERNYYPLYHFCERTILAREKGSL